jgi:SlyX protein
MPDANANANDLEQVHQRLESLEIKASYTEDLLDQLNMTIYQQQQLIERLVEEIKTLRQQVPDGGSGSVRNLRDELPPHY